MQYRRMDPGSAKRFLQMRREGQEPTLDDFVEVRGHGEPYPEDCVTRLRTELANIMTRYPEHLGMRDPQGGRFESEACAVVHRQLTFDPEAMTDPGFWIWLAVTQLSEVVEWRHKDSGWDALLRNYGIGARVESLIFRMWLRADLVVDRDAEDAYWLAKRGDQDLWRSHILRVSYSNVRPLVRELLLFQCPEDGKTTMDTEHLRLLARQLARLHANLLYEALDGQQLRELITAQAMSIGTRSEAAGTA